MTQEQNFTEGRIYHPLITFALPVLLALFLQAMYGGVDLLVVGQFASTADVSGVSTGSMIMQTVTSLIAGLTMGITVIVGQAIGRRDPEMAGKTIGSGIALFAAFSVVLAAVLVAGAGQIARCMHAPQEAFSQTTAYVRICGAGTFFIFAYNVLGGIFRGIGDSSMPLITVAIACVLNIAGDLLFVAVFHLGTAGAAYATVLSQAVSVLLSILIIRKRKLPFHFSRKDVCFNWALIAGILKMGTPIALQDLLVGMSFLVIQLIVNSIGLVASAGVGVAEKVCGFVMLVPSAFSQSMSAFTAQNIGALKPERARKALWYGIGTSLAVGLLMGYTAFFHGDMLSGLFARDGQVIGAASSYLKAYAIDCLLTSFLFCFIGYYNGCGKTLFVMLQGIFAAFCIRIPVAYFVSRIPGVSLFEIGLATPCSTIVQIIMCMIVFVRMKKNGSCCSIPEARS